jgi:hypothetical protein
VLDTLIARTDELAAQEQLFAENIEQIDGFLASIEKLERRKRDQARRLQQLRCNVEAVRTRCIEYGNRLERRGERLYAEYLKLSAGITELETLYQHDLQ